MDWMANMTAAMAQAPREVRTAIAHEAALEKEQKNLARTIL